MVINTLKIEDLEIKDKNLPISVSFHLNLRLNAVKEIL